MRPRHTAELLTVAAGMAIPFLTILLVLAVSGDVREWLLRGPAIIQQRNTILAELNADNAELKRLQSEAKTAQAQLKQARTDLKTAQRQVGEYKQQAGAALRVARSNEQQARSAQARTVAMTQTLRTAQGNFQRVQRSLTVAETSLGSVQRQFATLQKTYAELDKARQATLRSNQTLQAQNTGLSKDLSAKTKDLEELNRQLAQGQTDLRNTQAELKKTQQTVREAQAELETVKNDVKLVMAGVYQQFDTLNKSRNEPLIFRKGEELVRLTLPPNLSVDQAKAAWQHLLTQSRMVASAHGAVAGPSGQEAGLLALDDEETGQSVSVPQQEEALVKRVAGVARPLVIIATARYNAFKNEFVPIKPDIYYNPVIYRNGQIIAETRINGAATEHEIVDQVAIFVKQKVEDRARRDHMIPIEGREDAFGAVSSDELLKIVRQIKSTNRDVGLVAYVQKDTRAADPLDLAFRLR
jgi:uncharacterized protein (DUF3084 family)